MNTCLLPYRTTTDSIKNRRKDNEMKHINGTCSILAAQVDQETSRSSNPFQGGGVGSHFVIDKANIATEDRDGFFVYRNNNTVLLIFGGFEVKKGKKKRSYVV